jgi:hypothetical protein
MKVLENTVTYRNHSMNYRYVPRNDVSVNDGSFIRRWFHKIVI